MAAPTENDVNETQSFRSTQLIDRPVQTFRPSPAIRPNPFTGLGQTDPYNKKHNLVNEAPETMLEASRTNPIE